MSKVVTIIFAAAWCLMLSACNKVSLTGQKAERTEKLYDRVMQSGKLRCGYALYNPGCMKDPSTGKLYGIGVEVLEEICKKLGLEIVWAEEVGWGSMLEGLQTNRYDIIATPVWTQSNRAKIADFSAPLYYSPVLAYVKRHEKRFKNINSLNSAQVRVATIDGATGEVIASSDFPLAKKVSLPQLTDMSQLLLSIATGKADVAFTEPTSAIAYAKANPNSVEPLPGAGPIRVFPNCWTIRRDQYEFKAMIDTVLEELVNSGFVNKIVSKYESAPGTLYRTAPGYQPQSRH